MIAVYHVSLGTASFLPHRFPVVAVTCHLGLGDSKQCFFPLGWRSEVSARFQGKASQAVSSCRFHGKICFPPAPASGSLRGPRLVAPS